ncbi:sensor histidine kinase [Maribacter flavus]|uniref:Oxygen sensor histidine kinase NreB n=2 Tax=Maribacter flavus TaxID=1658664 RepID=A0A5B2TY84_9FLAO|nr:sensor histidine kinase [Maribacter flavus]
MPKTICLFIIVLISTISSAETPLERFYDLLKSQDFTAAKNSITLIGNEESKRLLGELIELLQLESNNTIMVLDEKDSDEHAFTKLLYQGYQYAYNPNRQSLEAYKKFSNALKVAQKMKNIYLEKAALIAILNLFSTEIFIGSKQYESFLERFTEIKSSDVDEALLILYHLVFFTKADDSLNDVDARYYNYMEKLDSLFLRIPRNNNLFSRYYYEKGMYYKIEQEFDKAEDFFLKSDSLIANNADLINMRASIAWQIAFINFQNNNFNKAKKYLKASGRLAEKLKDTFYIDRLNALIFHKEGQYDSAYHYLNKSLEIEYRLGYKNNTLESSILTVQNQTDKLKLDKLELDAQNKKIKIWTLGLGLALLFGSVIGVLTYKNTKRKQLLAEQGKILEEQKVATLLKDQELATIDAMIEGQEKERQRIAHDLHDDLGGLMANVKLHFNSLQEKSISNKQELYDKTNELLEEAYQKIRAIAHEKNSGVIAKQGLLRAVNQMADKISQSNRIAVSVQDFGLDNRLENSLELNLFRIIQELTTNIIKHSKATMANIHLTNHGDVLNILVEDNGIGFDPKTLKKGKDGMGLKSIDKRISQLEGTFHIESEPGKGSTIIIDIPI